MLQVDLLFLAADQVSDNAQLQFSSQAVRLPAERLVAGPIKAAQRWLIVFGTEKGSVPYHSEEGSSFLAALRSGRLATESDVFAAFAAADAEVESQLSREIADDDPDSEVIVSAQLQKLTINPQRLDLIVQLTTRSGTDVTLTAGVSSGSN